MKNKLSCEQVELLLVEDPYAALSENDSYSYGDGDNADVQKHISTCSKCSMLQHELQKIMSDVQQLPVLTPSKDLWNNIAEQLHDAREPAVTVHRTRNPSDVNITSRRTPSWLRMAAAAVVLVAVSATVTWNLRTAPTPATSDSLALQPVAYTTETIDATYEREILILRTIVNERFAELDSNTVSVLKRNIAIIDSAIADSKEALRKDPRNEVVTQQLDRALEHKLALLRRVALL